LEVARDHAEAEVRDEGLESFREVIALPAESVHRPDPEIRFLVLVELRIGRDADGPHADVRREPRGVDPHRAPERKCVPDRRRRIDDAEPRLIADARSQPDHVRRALR
jgi:hypothetical protein